MNHEFAANGPVTADIRVAAGKIDVDAGDHNVITVSVEPADNSSASREAAEHTEVTLDGAKLIVHAPRWEGWVNFRSPKLRVTVRVPAGSSLAVKTASADIACTGVYTDAEMQTASGDVNAERILRDASIRTASGDLRAGSVGGKLNARSASGDVRVQHVGGDAELQSASGDLEIGQLDGGVQMKTASGDVTVGIVRQGEMRINTVSGDVSVGVAAGTGVWLDISTVSGRTTSDLNMHGGTQPPEAGTALRLKARTVSGDVNLRRAAVSA